LQMTTNLLVVVPSLSASSVAFMTFQDYGRSPAKNNTSPGLSDLDLNYLLSIYWVISDQEMNNVDPHQAACMCGLICIYTINTCYNTSTYGLKVNERKVGRWCTGPLPCNSLLCLWYQLRLQGYTLSMKTSLRSQASHWSDQRQCSILTNQIAEI
jgi:hypothetical protein